MKLIDLRAREARVGQCDIETDAAALAGYQRGWSDGMTFVDQPTRGGPIDGYAHVIEERGSQLGTFATIVVEDWAAASPAALVRLLHLLGSLKDQYSFARITLPADLPLNRLLRESQVPHRQVDHPAAAARPYTRMQVRILDSPPVLEAMRLPPDLRGTMTLAIHHAEGESTRLKLDFDAGRVMTKPATGDADIALGDGPWASILTGDLPATTARSLGLLSCRSDDAIALLEGLARGPTPFCQEYF